jgi:DNA-binding CsgD family transcriptional regulator
MASQVSARRLQALQRQLQALELRRQGKRYEEIAEALGVSISSAWRLVHRAYKRSVKLADEEAEMQRQLDLQRLDVALAAIWPAVQAGELAAIDRLVSILGRRARLLGLDRPEGRKVDIGNALAEVLERLANRSDTADH